MSSKAVRYVASLEGLTPNEKLVFLHLAAAHNERSGQCNPSPARLARQTGLPVYQVNRMINLLGEKNYLTYAGGRFVLHLPANQNCSPIPADFWPSDDAIQILIERYPNHHFDLSEAVHDFIEFNNAAGNAFPASQLDRAFIANISAILDTRPTGQVAICRRAQRDTRAGIGSLLAGHR
jgi:hypothetical protein